MSYEYTLDVRGVRHGVDRHIATWRAPIDDADQDSTRSYPACGGYVDAKPDRGFAAVVTCVRCVVVDLKRIICTWCKPPGSGVDTCEADGRCVECGGNGLQDPPER